jgi:hypothetical protein
MSWVRRLWNTFRPRGMECDIERELSFHLAERADQLRAEGLGEEEARREARMKFGSVIVQAERTRDMNVSLSIDAFLRDVCYALRSLVRTRGEPAELAHTVRLKLKEREPLRSVYDIAPLEDRIGGAFAENRLRTTVLAFFAVTALTLACVGLYGTLSYVVNLRRREVGLRLALGAVGKKLVGQFLVQALRVVVMAIVMGLVLSFFFTRLLAGMLYGVSPGDPAVLATVVAIATVAALIPAMRAALVEPMQVLREG